MKILAKPSKIQGYISKYRGRIIISDKAKINKKYKDGYNVINKIGQVIKMYKQ